MKRCRLTRVCSVLLLVALLFSITVPFASAYSDVTRSAFPSYYDAINYVTDNGLMNGTSSTTFEPTTVISRAMIVRLCIVWREVRQAMPVSILPMYQLPHGITMQFAGL